MKATDFRPEHFEKGRSFSRSDFNAYVQASEKLARTAYTRYLPSVAAGLLLGLLFSRGVGGFAGNILAIVCIFAGLIVGAVFNAKAGRTVNALAQHLGITKEDVAIARKHVKNGTFAWTGEWEGQSREESPAPADIPDAVLDRPQAATAIPENPLRAVWAAGLLTVAWFLLAALLLAFRMRLSTTFFAFICLASAILGTAVYLLTQSGMKWKLAGAIAAAVSSLLLTSSEYGVRLILALGPKGRFSRLFSFNYPVYMRTLGSVALAVLLCLAAVMIYSVLHKDKGNKREGLCGAIAGMVYLAVRFLPWVRSLRRLFSHFYNSMSQIGQILDQQIYPFLVTALAVFLVCLALHSLCSMPQTRVKLRGIGTVWAWLALAGAVFTVFLGFYVAIVGRHRIAGVRLTGVYTHQMLLGLSALIGYALLLCKRRVGLYFILLGTGLMLGAQLVSALSGLGTGIDSRFVLSMFLSTLLGALNPLFAWLAVRAGETPG